MIAMKEGKLQSQVVKASSTVAKDAIVAYNATGILTATNAGCFAGIAHESGVAGDQVRVWQAGSFDLPGFAADLTAGDLYKPVYHLNGALSFSTATGAFIIGVLVEITGTRTGYVLIDGQIGNAVA